MHCVVRSDKSLAKKLIHGRESYPKFVTAINDVLFTEKEETFIASLGAVSTRCARKQKRKKKIYRDVCKRSRRVIINKSSLL